MNGRREGRQERLARRLALAFKVALAKGFVSTSTLAAAYRQELGMVPKTALNTARRDLERLERLGCITFVAEGKPTIYALTPFGALLILVAVRAGYTETIGEEEVLSFLARREELIPYAGALRYLRSCGLKTSEKEREEKLPLLLSLLERAPARAVEALLSSGLKELREQREWPELARFVVVPLVHFLEDEPLAKVMVFLKEALEAADHLQRSHVLEALRLSLELLRSEAEEEKRKAEEKIEKVNRLKQTFNL